MNRVTTNDYYELRDHLPKSLTIRSLVMTRIIALLLFVVPISPCWADSPDIDRVTKAITPYLNGDTFAVATLAVDEAWPTVIGDLLVDYKIVTDDEIDSMRKGIEQTKGALATLREFGVREVSIVAGVADMRPEAMPLAAVTCDEPQKDAIDLLLKQFLLEPTPQVAHQWVDDTVLVGTPATIERYETLKTSDRKDLIDALRKAVANNASGGLVAAPGNDVRRVLRELWPTLPNPYSDLDAKLMADGIRQLSVTLRRPPEWRARVAIETASEANATTLEQLAETGLNQLVVLAGEQYGGKPIATALKQALPLLSPKQQGNQLTIDLVHDKPDVKQMVINVLLPAVENARESARLNSHMNDMKQIALAMHNYHSTFGTFPASAAICDKDGKPLLSWRVAILPFIEQKALFDKFHLDEPWDSEHNLKLAKEVLPGVYFGNVSDELKMQAKTTYQVPITEGTGFAPIEKANAEVAGDAMAGFGEGNEAPAGRRKDSKVVERKFQGRTYYTPRGSQFRDIIDGSSLTIMAVQVADENAVFWTKPEDWSPDLADPMAKLKQAGRNSFVSAWMDGHAKMLPFDMNRELLKKMLTNAGREVIERDEIP